MSHIENNKYLSDVSVPGTHDSTTNRLMYERGAEHNIPGVNHPVDLLPFELKTNSYDIVDQLNAGIRLFDLRIAPNPDSPNELILMHASAYCLDEQGNKMKLANVFNIFYSFLKKT
ncbi:hypothetical protein FACS1894218_1390 [Bacilli bacterium]|nr:hypothetical protein FACS1894218_1390 [Bacilli bacterium]